MKNTVDLGCFDPRGTQRGGPGFRGWQGGAGRGFDITGDLAGTSTWYLAGPLQPGTWHLAQYFLKSTPSGLKYKYTITLSFEGVKPPKRMVRPPTYSPGILDEKAGWYAGNLHCHSVHSDGALSLVELAKRNRKFGFNFMASTEHNTPAAHFRFFEVAKEVPDLLLLEGTELTTPGGHANIIGQKPGYWWDFRTQPGDGGLALLLKEVAQQKAIFMINHPFAMCTSCPWLFKPGEWKGANGIEVWNGAWDLTDQKAVDWWDSLLKQGQRLNAYGGTDYHRGEDPPLPVSWTYAKNLSGKEILEGLRRGHVALSASVEAPRVELWLDGKMPGSTVKGRADSTLKILVKGGKGKKLYLRTAAGPIQERALSYDDEACEIPLSTIGAFFIRAELRDAGGNSTMLAMTNAVFVGP
ncbi:MAG: CehA/McbA family metallohydrolase [Chlorobia bacterium]|nr:CehA/McbA family metallohydrolase [Fimbriimonadaceae bacterium]